LLRRLFTERGYRVVVAPDIEKAQALLRSRPLLGAILADRRRDADYLPLIRWIRRGAQTTGLPVLTLIREQNVELAVAAQDAGSDLALFTPIDLSFLVSSMAALIRRAHGAYSAESVDDEDIATGTSA
jgi:DNA-binding response OmpR family regulator